MQYKVLELPLLSANDHVTGRLSRPRGINRLTHDFNELVQLLRSQSALFSDDMALGQCFHHAGNEGVSQDLESC